MRDAVEIPPHLNGPPDSANGGIACGEVALLLGVDTEVTLKLPPPLGEPMQVRQTSDGVTLHDASGALIAAGRRAVLELQPPPPLAYALACEASKRFAGHRYHAFPTCFSCGPGRKPEEALCIHPGPITPGTKQPVAGPWQPHPNLADPQRPTHAHLRYVAAAIDCPGGWAIMPDKGHVVLGRMHLSLRAAPRIGEPCVAIGWAIGQEGRKYFAGTVAYGDDGRILGLGRQTWIRVSPGS